MVLDSGVIDRATGNQEFRWVLRDLIEHGWEPVIPTVTLSEAITGRPQDAPVNPLINRIGSYIPTRQRLEGQANCDFGSNDPVPVGRRLASTPSSPPMRQTPKRRRCSLRILLTFTAYS